MTRFSKYILNSAGQAMPVLYRTDHTAKGSVRNIYGMQYS